MAFKLVIGTQLDVPIKGEIPDGAGKLAFRFALQMRRLGVAEYRKLVAPESDVLVRDFILDNAIGWRDQRLVLDDDGQPAAFHRDALACLLDVVGMEHLVFQAYLQALAVVDKPAGRAGN